MVKLLKLVFLLLVIITYFYLLGFAFYESFYWQGGALALVFILHLLKESGKSTWNLLLILMPFTVTLFIFGLFFQLIKLQGRSDWLQDSLIKVIFFPSSFIFTKLIISCFTYRDILSLPIKLKIKREIIFIQTFFRKAYRIFPRLNFYAKIHPGLQNCSGMKKKFIILCSFPLSLYLFLVEEGEILEELYLNRLRNLEDK